MIFNAAELFRIGVGLPWTKMAEQSLFDESAYPMSRTNINDTANTQHPAKGWATRNEIDPRWNSEWKNRKYGFAVTQACYDTRMGCMMYTVDVRLRNAHQYQGINVYRFHQAIVYFFPFLNSANFASSSRPHLLSIVTCDYLFFFLFLNNGVDRA